jgi:hypothetical protein
LDIGRIRKKRKKEEEKEREKKEKTMAEMFQFTLENQGPVDTAAGS